ncbi:restriction endonuclease subunit S [Pantoea agglomerans]|uniref:Restriction endonuclease subunit S n=1 Tax=Enterobacter agglomerans TaxID=549 RepID=A0ACC5RNS9_ENTAG|nr:restriction endonuclease subunit S [Pantoea agglomerans]MBK4726351.1 restriction endonuclease subunit S [Pantoea agglomerans]
MTKYQAYPEYKDSGVEWLGEIPAHWQVCRLKNLAMIRNGQDYKTVQAESGYPVMGSGGQFSYATEFMYDKPSVLLGRKGTIDKPLYVNVPFWTVDTMYYTEINSDIDAKYLHYLSLTILFSRYSTNTALPSMTQESLSNYFFSVPPSKFERSNIKYFLDHETKKIDSLIEKQQQLIELLKEKRQAVISHAVTKGLNPDAPMKDSGVEWLGEVPEHWDIIYIKHITEVKRGASPRPIDDPKYFDEEGEYAWTRISDVSSAGMYLTETTQRLSKLGSSLSVKLEANQLFLSIAGTVGKPCLTTSKACIHDGFVYFPTLTIDSKLLYYIFEAGQAYLGLGKMGTQLNLNTDTVGGIKIGLPSNNEIKLIVEAIEQQKEKYDVLISTACYSVELMQERRTALISAAVTGKIDVRNWVAPAVSEAAADTASQEVNA